MDSISNEVKDCYGIQANSQSLDVDKDYFPSSPDGKIDPSEKVMSQFKALSLDEIKDFPITSESDDEALTSKYIEAWLEKLRNMTPEVANAAIHEVYGKTYVAMSEAGDATSKVKKAVSHVRAMHESVEKYSRTELEKMWSPQTPDEALKEAFERCDAAMRDLYAAKRTVDKSIRLVQAMSKACEKRPMTGPNAAAAKLRRAWIVAENLIKTDPESSWERFCDLFVAAEDQVEDGGPESEAYVAPSDPNTGN